MEVYMDHGMKVRSDILNSFQEYQMLISTLDAMNIDYSLFAKAYDWGESGNYEHQLAVYAESLSEAERNAIIESSVEDNIIDALDLKINTLYTELKRAFIRRYRGYHIQVFYIDDSQDQYNGCISETMIFKIANPYKAGITSLATQFSIATTS